MALALASAASAFPISCADPLDVQFLSPYQCYVRSNCLEYFIANKVDCENVGSGRSGKISVGRVGIRCVFCKSIPNDEKAILVQSCSYPASLRSMQSTLTSLPTRHFPSCKIPKKVRNDLKNASHKAPRKPEGIKMKLHQYLQESAERKGLADTEDEGIRLASSITTTNANSSRNSNATSANALTLTSFGNNAAAGESSSAPHAFTESNLLERTRHELLNGRDFWMCTTCGVGVPSLTMPCGKCNKYISFVPLEVREFEEFVKKQMEMKRRADMIAAEQQQEEDDSSEESSGDENVKPKSKKAKAAKPQVSKILDPNMELVTALDAELATPYTHLIMQQMRACNLETTLGRRNVSFAPNFPGLQCKHCSGEDKPRRFFFRSADVFAANYGHMPNHLLVCKGCPAAIKKDLRKKKNEHGAFLKDLPRGANKLFFATIWEKFFD